MKSFIKLPNRTGDDSYVNVANIVRIETRREEKQILFLISVDEILTSSYATDAEFEIALKKLSSAMDGEFIDIS